MTPHFSEQCMKRGFSTLDAELVIERGEVIGGPTYDEEHHSWKCEVFGKVDGKGWNLVVALECNSDFHEAPLITYVTAHRMRVKDAHHKKSR